jgi:acyl transferase domain-containing protein/NADPH:quinone reductase-like Zn-dependent oxidoreductase/acyl carrier protein/NADP-dependent 3-hydroxy acid dehydrogenase YdfG
MTVRAAAREAVTVREPIAIVGMACRFPGGANDTAAYWRLLREGYHAPREVPADRWDVDAYYDPDPDTPGATATRFGSFVDDAAGFDAGFFRISPREAAAMDPQQRMFLEACWHALEDAGCRIDELAGSSTGVYGGISTSDYLQLSVKRNEAALIEPHTATGNAFGVLTGRVSYALGLHGPSFAVDTACSSALVAIHVACRALRAGECDLALAGGVNGMFSPETFVNFSRARMLAPDGRCKTFDASADGYVRGEGCGVVVLKRLRDAQRAGDRVLAVIRGSAVNHDGRSNGLTAPNGFAQEAVIRAALADADAEPDSIDYVEAHGTGTPLGDPIELRALGRVFGGRTRPLVVGSVKTNVGHLEAAAGVAGLIKVVLALRHGEIPPHANFRTPSPHVAWDQLPVRIPTELTAWPERGGAPRRAGVSSFGFGGTNAHLVLESAPQPAPLGGEPAPLGGEPAPLPGEPAPLDGKAAAPRPVELFTLSAKGAPALAALAARYADAIGEREPAPGDLCFSANTTRAALSHRAALTVSSAPEAAAALGALARGELAAGVEHGVADGSAPQLVFLFTGQGAQYAGMGRELYEREPVFHDALERCDAVLREHGVPLLRLLHGELGAQLDRTIFTQPALFALEYALAEQWRSWGVEPAAVAGHSVGEYVAACIAGVLALEDALALVAARGRLMQSLPPTGAMAAVRAEPERVEPLLAGPLAVAALNAPGETVVSGEREAIAALSARLGAAGIAVVPLRVSHAFHSPLMDPILEEFEAIAARCAFAPPQLRLLSNLSGTWAGDELTRPRYWRDHLRGTVRFAQSVRTAADEGHHLFLELGPQPTLCALGARTAPDAQWLPSLRRERSDLATMLHTAGALWVRGVPLDRSALHAGRRHDRVSLPLYPFQHERFWLERPPRLERSAPPAIARASGAPSHPLLGARLSSALDAVQFESEIDLAREAYLGDHRVFGKTVLPAAAYVELGTAAAHALWSGSAAQLEDVTIERPIFLEPGAPARVQTVAEREGDDAASLRIFVRDAREDGERWNVHGSARLRRLDRTEPPPVSALGAARARCTEPVDVEAFYAHLHERGLEYGPAFRGVGELWRGPGEALGRLRLSDITPASAAQHHAHPALLDAALHVLGAASSDASRTYLPVGVERAVVHAGGLREGWALARVRENGTRKSTVRADVTIFDGDGRLAVELHGLRLQRVARTAWQEAPARPPSELTYRVAWREAPPRPPGAPAAGGAWLILADREGTAAALAEELRRAGCEPRLLDDDADDDALAAAVDERAWSGVVHLWSLDAAEGANAEARLVRRAAALVTALAARARAPRPTLWLVTRGAQPAGSDVTAGGLLGAPLWGFGNVAALEHPEVPCRRVDLDASGEDVAALAAELAASDGEDRVALRGAARFVARLEPFALPPAATAAPRRLEIRQRGILDDLELRPAERRAPGPGEVEIAVRAGGLNFRDVLGALGMYPGDPGPLGSECAGTIVAAGDGVTGFAVGDEVVAIAPGCFASFVLADARTVWRKPPQLTFEQAAAIPIAFLTAWYGLHELARIEPGTRVLVHSGAGGVGQAAVQLALRAGAQVYATASEPKWDAVRALGVEHVYDSRSLAFAERIAAETGGRGVDVVLNSFSGPYIEKSLALLAPGGTFLEIGKREIWSEERMRAARPDVRYTAYDLAELLRERADLHAMLAEALDAFARGELRAPAITDFPFERAAEAFRYMAQAKHVGKIVLHQPPAPGSPVLRADRTYVVTGAFGALGALVADWMVANGARSLLLIGRSPSDAARASLERLRERCPGASAAFADLSDRDALAGALGGRADGLPLGGVVHAAGTLDDAFLEQLDGERIARVTAPKVSGTRHLHELTRGEPLEFFVTFSSVSAVFGTPGQASYASANAFLDAFAHRRAALGLPATSIGWGPWEAGMAAGLERRAAPGVRWIDAETGLAVLGALLRAPDARHAVVLPVAWDEFLAQFPAGGVPPLLEEIAGATRAPNGAVPATGAFVETLRGAPAKRRRALAVAHVAQTVAAVLGLADARAIGPRDGLTSLGMDSLMAVELRSRLQGGFGIALPATIAFEHPTVEAIADYLLAETFPAEAAAPVPEPQRTTAVETVREELDALSEDQLAELLERELRTLQTESS